MAVRCCVIDEWEKPKRMDTYEREPGNEKRFKLLDAHFMNHPDDAVDSDKQQLYKRERRDKPCRNNGNIDDNPKKESFRRRVLEVHPKGEHEPWEKCEMDDKSFQLNIKILYRSKIEHYIECAYAACHLHGISMMIFVNKREDISC